jgi:hypothetical protein
MDDERIKNKKELQICNVAAKGLSAEIARLKLFLKYSIRKTSPFWCMNAPIFLLFWSIKEK